MTLSWKVIVLYFLLVIFVAFLRSNNWRETGGEWGVMQKRATARSWTSDCWEEGPQPLYTRCEPNIVLHCPLLLFLFFTNPQRKYVSAAKYSTSLTTRALMFQSASRFMSGNVLIGSKSVFTWKEEHESDDTQPEQGNCSAQKQFALMYFGYLTSWQELQVGLLTSPFHYVKEALFMQIVSWLFENLKILVVVAQSLSQLWCTLVLMLKSQVINTSTQVFSSLHGDLTTFNARSRYWWTVKWIFIIIAMYVNSQLMLTSEIFVFETCLFLCLVVEKPPLSLSGCSLRLSPPGLVSDWAESHEQAAGIRRKL